MDPLDLNTNALLVEPTIQDLALNRLAEEAKRKIEERAGFRLSLATINLEKKKFDLYHLPSSTIIMIQHADKVAEEVYLDFAERINAILEKAD